jgi:hypothetical protein
MYLVATDTLVAGKAAHVLIRKQTATACELSFRGSLDEWERLMGAVARR